MFPSLPVETEQNNGTKTKQWILSLKTGKRNSKGQKMIGYQEMSDEAK